MTSHVLELPDAEVLAHAIHTLAVGMAAKQRCSVQTTADLVLIAATLHSPARPVPQKEL